MARNCQGSFLGAMTSWSLSILIGVCPAQRPRWDWFKCGPPLLMEGWVGKKPVEHCLEALGNLINQEVIQLCVLKIKWKIDHAFLLGKHSVLLMFSNSIRSQQASSPNYPEEEGMWRGEGKPSTDLVLISEKNEALCGETESSQDILQCLKILEYPTLRQKERSKSSVQ